MLAPVAARAGFTTVETLGSGDVGKELANNTVYKVESDLTLTNTGTGPGLKLAVGATAVIYIKEGVTLTVNGGNSSGRSAGDAGLRVLSGRTLVVTGGGKLVATGGNAGNGANGGDAGACSLDMSGNSHGGHGGAGGNGGAGASAGIGGYGGYGGYGGSSPSDESWVETNDTDDYDRDGHNGNGGDAGGNGDDMGTVYLLGSLNVTATGGSGGSGGSPGGNTGGEHDSNWSGVNWYYVGGAGGGGGGAGGIAPYYAIGGGGGGGGGGGSGGNGGLYWKGSGGTGTINKPDGAGGQGGWDNGVSSSRTEPDYAQSSSGTKYKHGGYRGSGGAKGANGGNGTLYRDSGVTLNATYASATSATTHSAIEYLLVFDDAQRVYEAMDVKLGYAYPAAPIPPSRPGWTFNGWFTEKNGGGTKYYNADGTATAVEWATCSDVTLYASWTLTDPDAAAAISINGVGLVGGTSTSGYGWDYNGADGRLTLTASTGSYVITGKDETGEFSIYAAANLCTVVMSNLTMNASNTIARPPFESVSGKIATLQFEGVNKLTGCSGYPAIYVAEGSSVTIGGAGQVEANGGANAPGIGGRTGETRGTAKLNIMGGTIVANGGANGSGIGAAVRAGFGITTISGGTITATGKDGAAGIGGSDGAGMGTYIITGGTVTANGGANAPGFGSGMNAIGGTMKITGGTVTATGGNYGAGIGTGRGATNGIIEISGGTVTARGGKSGAGIGGGHKAKDVSISVTGGNIIAVGGNYGAGIGAGDGDIGDSQNVTISISGGRIEADGGINAAGIGSGDYASCGAITISGGTVNVTADTGAKQIGNGRDGYGKASSVTITGGAVYPALAQVSPAPTNTASKAVFPIDFEIGEVTNKVTSLTLSGALASYSYGVNDAYTDASGKLRVWLPATDGAAFVARIEMASGAVYYFSFDIDGSGNVTPRGFLVINDGIVASNVDNSGSGWSFSKDTGDVTISADADIQGFSTNGEYRIVVPADSGASTVLLKNLTLVGPTKRNASAMDIGRDVALVLSGANTVTTAGRYSAGIGVASTATLTVKGEGSLSAAGGKCAAGIGSAGGLASPGKIVIESGTIVAQGGSDAAGIGGGLSSNLTRADNIVISGGNVTATGGENAAGIGSGYVGKISGDKTLADGAVKISGGTVFATRGAEATYDFISSGNKVSTTAGAKAFCITGGSVHGANLGAYPNPIDAYPNPVDANGVQLRYLLFTNLTAGAEAKFVSPDIPAAYGMNDVVADSTGSICLWLPYTNMVRAVNVNGLYFSGGGTTNNVFDVKSGSSEPVDRRKEGSVTRWRVKVPGLVPDAAVTLQIGAECQTLSDKADANGNYFFYVADGRYLFKANGLDYAVVVDRADAVAQRIDLTPTGVFADGIDVSEGLGSGWRYDFATSNLFLSAAGPYVLSGTNLEGRVAVIIESAGTDDTVVTLSSLSLRTAGAAAPVSVSSNATLRLLLEGTNSLENAGSARYAANAAIHVPATGALSIASASKAERGVLFAQGGYGGAGIGGSYMGKDNTGSISIEGGEVRATGGLNSAGIGGGWQGAGGVIEISGGIVDATGNASPGIGSGMGDSAALPVYRQSGGTVVARGANGADVGGGMHADGEALLVTGGSLHLANAGAATIPLSNATERVWCVTVPDLPPNEPVSVLKGLPDAYGTADIVADDSGAIYLWLPDGRHTMEIGDDIWFAEVDGADTTAAKVVETGVFVDGAELSELSGDGWDFSPQTRVATLRGAGPFTISGDGTNIGFLAASDCAVTFDSLSISNNISKGLPPFDCGSCSVSISICGTNTILSTGSRVPGIRVVSGASLAIDDARPEGLPPSTLLVTAGYNAAGIGCGYEENAGSISIAGGVVTVHGGEDAASIGACSYGSCEAIYISGGVVTADSSVNRWGGAGIGGSRGFYGAGGKIVISGGEVTAKGGSQSPGIGGGPFACSEDAYRSSVTISGGIVKAIGGMRAPGIGCGDQGGFGPIRIESGTVVSIGGEKSPDMGDCATYYYRNSIVFTGGAIYTDIEGMRPTPTNDVSSAVYPVDFALGTPDAKVESIEIVRDGEAYEYGTKDLYADADGKLRIWLPNGGYEFQVDGEDWTAEVDGAANTARKVGAGPDSLRIEGISVEDGKVTLVVSAEPDGWLTAETAPQLRVRAAAELPLPEGDAALLPREDVEISANGDGTATAVAPRAADAPRTFYRVEAGD